MAAEKELDLDPKPAVSTADVESDSLPSDDSQPSFDEKRTKALLRKLDYRLIPYLSLLYLLSFLDRSNIGNAKIFRLEKSLGLQGNQYNIALCVFFITYVLFEVPSNMILKRWRAVRLPKKPPDLNMLLMLVKSMWFPVMMLAWGLVMTLMGLVTSFAGLVVARLFLGVTEAGLFPGVNYYITLWYRRSECAFRAAIFFSAATVAGAFGGLLARGINEMDGLSGKPGWAYIFILEGIITVIVAFTAFWMIADNPATAKFLNDEEKKEVQNRLAHDNDDLANHYDIKFMWIAFRSWKIWLQCVAYMGLLVPTYSYSLFLPAIVNAMGYSAARSQLLTVPPYILGCICTVVAGYLSDKYKKRAIFLIGHCCLAIIGYILLISNGIPGVQYFGTFLAASGSYPMVPVMVMWNGNNIGGSVKRGVGIAMQIAIGNCGGIIASFIYRNQDAPRYFVGHGCVIAFLTLSLILVIAQMFILAAINRKRDHEFGSPALYTSERRRREMDMGDEASFFRYTI